MITGIKNDHVQRSRNYISVNKYLYYRFDTRPFYFYRPTIQSLTINLLYWLNVPKLTFPISLFLNKTSYLFIFQSVLKRQHKKYALLFRTTVNFFFRLIRFHVLQFNFYPFYQCLLEDHDMKLPTHTHISGCSLFRSVSLTSFLIP